MRKLPKIVCGLALLLSIPTHAQKSTGRRTEGPVTIQVEKTRIRLSAATDFVLFADSGESIAGIVGAGHLQYALTRNWALGAGLRQGFSSSGFTSFFTEIHMSVARSLTGVLMSTHERVSVDGVPVSDSVATLPKGWVSRFYLSQYFINTSGAVLPYTGLGLGVSYDWNHSSGMPISVGARFDRITNGTKSYFPMSVFATLGLWL